MSSPYWDVSQDSPYPAPPTAPRHLRAHVVERGGRARSRSEARSPARRSPFPAPAAHLGASRSGRPAEALRQCFIVKLSSSKFRGVPAGDTRHRQDARPLAAARRNAACLPPRTKGRRARVPAPRHARPERSQRAERRSGCPSGQAGAATTFPSGRGRTAAHSGTRAEAMAGRVPGTALPAGPTPPHVPGPHRRGTCRPLPFPPPPRPWRQASPPARRRPGGASPAHRPGAAAPAAHPRPASPRAARPRSPPAAGEARPGPARRAAACPLAGVGGRGRQGWRRRSLRGDCRRCCCCCRSRCGCSCCRPAPARIAPARARGRRRLPPCVPAARRAAARPAPAPAPTPPPAAQEPYCTGDTAGRQAPPLPLPSLPAPGPSCRPRAAARQPRLGAAPLGGAAWRGERGHADRPAWGMAGRPLGRPSARPPAPRR